MRLRGVLGRVRAGVDDDAGLRAWLDLADRDLDAAFHGCLHGEWLARLLVAARVDRTLLVYAATGCSRAAMEHAGLSDRRAHAAIEIARAWAEREASGAECWAAGCAAAQASTELARTAPAAACAAASAAATAFACDSNADESYYASRGYAVEAIAKAAAAWGDDVSEGSRHVAEVIRLYISLADLVEAVRSSTAPPPPGGSSIVAPAMTTVSGGGAALPAGAWPDADADPRMISFDPITGS